MDAVEGRGERVGALGEIPRREPLRSRMCSMGSAWYGLNGIRGSCLVSSFKTSGFFHGGV